MRMGRMGVGHRDWRDVSLKSQILAILRRSQAPQHYGNPYISWSDKLLLQEATFRRVAKAQDLHRSTRAWRNFPRLRSANQGLTVAVKDNIVTATLPTTCASKILTGFRPSENATVTQLLDEASMILVGKTNMDEFGMGSHSTWSAYKMVYNGIRHDILSVGGSSGGSALAVAQNLAHVGIGTDTGGSVRLPAAYMSLFGFKPSYGMISRYGVVPYANSLDTVGILATTATDVRLTFELLSTSDDRDPTCLTKSSRRRIMDAKNRRRRAVLGSKFFYIAGSPNHFELPRYPPPGAARANSEARHDRILGSQREFTRRIGVPLEYNIEEMHPLVRWSWIATLSYLQNVWDCEIVPISLPSTKHALSSYYVLAPAEASSNLAKYDGVRYGAARTGTSDEAGDTLYSQYRGRNFGPEVLRRILLGTYTLSAGAMDNYFIQAQKVRRLVQQDFDAVFRMPNPLRDNTEVNMNGVDVIIVPTAPTPPPYLKFLEKAASPVERYMNDVFTVPASLAGLPSMSVPGPPHPDHPWTPEVAVGIQVIGQYGDDYSVMYFAQNYLSRFHPKDIMRVKETRILD